MMQLMTTRETMPRSAREKTRRFACCAIALAHLAAFAGIGTRAAAQQDVVPFSDEPRYTVELIVFRYREDGSAGNEIFVPDKPTLVPDAEELDQAAPTQNVFTDTPENPANPPGVEAMPEEELTEGELAGEEQPEKRERIELHLLEEGDPAMDEIFRKLERLDAYEPIMRAAWTQTTPAKGASPAVHLRALGEPPAGLDGSITLYLGRFLHLVVDLALDANEGGARGTSATDRLVAYGDERAVDNYGREEYGRLLNQPVRYRILEDRIMKTGEVRYFDHPRFGVVAKITRPPLVEELPDDAVGDSPGVAND